MQHTALPCLGVLALSPRFQGYGGQFSLNTEKANLEHTEQTDNLALPPDKEEYLSSLFLSLRVLPLCASQANTSELLPSALLLKR